jgi:hypothetical protein
MSWISTDRIAKIFKFSLQNVHEMQIFQYVRRNAAPVTEHDGRTRTNAKGAASLEKAAMADEILKLVQNGEVNTASSLDMTHALFSEVGGKKTEDYIVPRIPTRRVFRSKFAEFWFKKYVAPRILFKSYNAAVLNVIFAADTFAAGGERGYNYDDLFHKLLPLGKWDVKDVPLKQEPSRWSILSLATYFGVRGTIDVDR